METVPGSALTGRPVSGRWLVALCGTAVIAGALALSWVSRPSKPPPPPGSTSLAAVPAATALAAIETSGQPPADIVASLAVPSSARPGAARDIAGGAGQYERQVALSVPASVTDVAGFFRVELPAHGWKVTAVSTTDGGRGTEVLATHGSSDTYVWEVGVQVAPAAGGSTATVRLTQLSDES